MRPEKTAKSSMVGVTNEVEESANNGLQAARHVYQCEWSPLQLYHAMCRIGLHFSNANVLEESVKASSDSIIIWIPAGWWIADLGTALLHQ